MEEIQGIPLRRCPQGAARREAARQLLDSYYRQILTAGFFHADPHPGNLLWWNDKVYFLDFGMVGELGPEVRETLLLLLLAMWQGDAEFLTDVILMMSPAERRGDVDVAAFRAEMATMLARYRHQSVKDLQLGAVLQDMSQIAVRQGVPLPAELVLTGKALAQVQLATGELDPDLDPFAMAGEVLKSTFLSDLQQRMDLRKLLYEGQKLKVRAARLLDAVEALTGARPGPKLQVEVRGAEQVEQQIRRSGRRLSLAVTAAGALVGAAVTASSDLAGWVPTTMGAAAAALVLGLVVDAVRGKEQGGR
jgi:predicted unusual protein kinase regulating ubiquinone biosynthesis (AarF/ABC1/UbiB family)